MHSVQNIQTSILHIYLFINTQYSVHNNLYIVHMYSVQRIQTSILHIYLFNDTQYSVHSGKGTRDFKTLVVILHSSMYMRHSTCVV